MFIIYKLQKHGFNLTNIGNPLPVFSFVKQALLEFNKNYKPKYISFTSDLNSRKQLNKGDNIEIRFYDGTVEGKIL